MNTPDSTTAEQRKAIAMVQENAEQELDALAIAVTSKRISLRFALAKAMLQGHIDCLANLQTKGLLL